MCVYCQGSCFSGQTLKIYHNGLPQMGLETTFLFESSCCWLFSEWACSGLNINMQFWVCSHCKWGYFTNRAHPQLGRSSQLTSWALICFWIQNHPLCRIKWLKQHSYSDGTRHRVIGCHRVIPTWHQRPKVLRYTSYREDRMGLGPGRSWEMTMNHRLEGSFWKSRGWRSVFL